VSHDGLVLSLNLARFLILLTTRGVVRAKVRRAPTLRCGFCLARVAERDALLVLGDAHQMVGCSGSCLAAVCELFCARPESFDRIHHRFEDGLFAFCGSRRATLHNSGNPDVRRIEKCLRPESLGLWNLRVLAPSSCCTNVPLLAVVVVGATHVCACRSPSTCASPPKPRWVSRSFCRGNREKTLERVLVPTMRRTVNLACTAKQVHLDSCYASVQGPQICQVSGAAP
jgi:hypothetical protein